MLALALLPSGRWSGECSCSGASASAGRSGCWRRSWSRRASRFSPRRCAPTWTCRSWRWSWARRCSRCAGRGAACPVLVLLGLAGLLRPEAWLLAGAYWLYLLPALDRRRDGSRSAALVAAAPVLWALSDLVVTGEPLHSLTSTRDTAETLGRPHGHRRTCPRSCPAGSARSCAGCRWSAGRPGSCWRCAVARERALVPAALAVLGGLAFVVIGDRRPARCSAATCSCRPRCSRSSSASRRSAGWTRPRDRGAALVGRPAASCCWWRSSARRSRTRPTGSTGCATASSCAAGSRTTCATSRERRRASRCSSAAGRSTCPTTGPCRSSPGTSTAPPDEIVSAQLEPPRRGPTSPRRHGQVAEKFVLDPRDPKRYAVPARAGRVHGTVGGTTRGRCTRGDVVTDKMDRAPASENELPGVSAAFWLRPG